MLNNNLSQNNLSSLWLPCQSLLPPFSYILQVVSLGVPKSYSEMGMIAIVWLADWLVGWGGLRCWLQLVCCTYLLPSVQVFWVERSQGSGLILKDIWKRCRCHARQCHKFWGLGFSFRLSIPRGARLCVRVGNELSRLYAQSQFTRCLNYLSKRSLYTSCSQVSGGTGMQG